MAKINQDRYHQINEKQTRQLQEIVKDAEIDEKLLSGLDEHRKREQEVEKNKKFERLQGKYVIINWIINDLLIYLDFATTNER